MFVDLQSVLELVINSVIHSMVYVFPLGFLSWGFWYCVSFFKETSQA